MAVKRRGLGRGLDALLGPSEVPGAPTVERPHVLASIPLDLLQRGRYQPRTDLREDSLEGLASSIRAQGVVQPIVVRPLGGAGAERRYEIIAGERRWRAAQLAGLGEIPALVRDVPDEAAVALALIENIQRENLNPLEEAGALSRLIEEFEMTHEQAAEAVGRSRAAVSNLLRLLELADEVKTLLERRELEMGHARALLGLTARSQQAEAAAQVVRRGLSVRETEQLVKRLQRGEASQRRAAEPGDPNIRRVETDLAERLGAKVAVKHTSRGSGSLIISYHSLDELDGILAHIK